MYNTCIAAIIKQLNTTLRWPVLANTLHKICMLLLISATANY